MYGSFSVRQMACYDFIIIICIWQFYMKIQGYKNLSLN